MAARCGNPPCAEHQGAQGDADDGDVNADDEDHKGKNDDDCDYYIFLISSLMILKKQTQRETPYKTNEFKWALPKWGGVAMWAMQCPIKSGFF